MRTLIKIAVISACLQTITASLSDWTSFFYKGENDIFGIHPLIKKVGKDSWKHSTKELNDEEKKKIFGLIESADGKEGLQLSATGTTSGERGTINQGTWTNYFFNDATSMLDSDSYFLKTLGPDNYFDPEFSHSTGKAYLMVQPEKSLNNSQIQLDTENYTIAIMDGNYANQIDFI